MSKLPDVQNRPDTRDVDLNQVGINHLRYPIRVLDRAGGWQHTVGEFALSVALPAQFKGTHMSRFLEVLEEHQSSIASRNMPALLADLRERLDAEIADVQVRFPYFIRTPAPATEKEGWLDYDCTFRGVMSGEDSFVFRLTVASPITTLCPCSKEISDYGAHNQRSTLTITIEQTDDLHPDDSLVWIEELAEIANSVASCPVYPLLKRPDERHVTMQAYEKPAFVEDVVRDAAVILREDPRVAWYEVRAVNQESIHNHDAFAVVTSDDV